MLRLATFALLTISSAFADTGVCKVKNSDDSGRNSLRDCCERANNSIGGAGSSFTILFANKLDTISIASNLPEVTAPETLIIRGPRSGVTIDATTPDESGNLPFVFFVGAGVSLNVYNVNVFGGFEAVRVGFGGSARDVSLTLFNVNFSQSQASCVVVATPVSEVSITSSSFTDCGNDGVNIVAFGQNGPYNLAVKRVIASGNVNYGFFFEVHSTTAGGFVTVSKYEGLGNGEYGMELLDLGAGRMTVPLVELSKFNNNNEGLEFVNADVQLIRLCEFNFNTEYGLGLEQSHLTAIKASSILENGAYGIDLEALASIEAIDATKIVGNALGVIKCGPEPSAEPARRAISGHNEEPTKGN